MATRTAALAHAVQRLRYAELRRAQLRTVDDLQGATSGLRDLVDETRRVATVTIRSALALERTAVAVANDDQLAERLADIAAYARQAHLALRHGHRMLVVAGEHAAVAVERARRLRLTDLLSHPVRATERPRRDGRSTDGLIGVLDATLDHLTGTHRACHARTLVGIRCLCLDPAELCRQAAHIAGLITLSARGLVDELDDDPTLAADLAAAADHTRFAHAALRHSHAQFAAASQHSGACLDRSRQLNLGWVLDPID